MTSSKLRTLKNINFDNNINLEIQSELIDDWQLKDLNNKAYFYSNRLNKRIDLSNKKILKIYSTLKKTLTKDEDINIIGRYGFINNEFYEELEYNKNLSYIKDRLNILPLKHKDLIIGNLYERPDGSIFIYLGERYIIKKIIKKDNSKSIIIDSLSSLKKVNYVFEATRGFYIIHLDNDNFKVYKDLGTNNIYDKEYITQYLNDYLSSKEEILKFYASKSIKNVSINLKKIEYSSSMIEELKKSKSLIINTNNGFYKYLKLCKKETQERVTGRPSSKVTYEYELYQKIRIEDGMIKTYPKLGNIMKSCNSWYGSSSYTFEDSVSFGRKSLHLKSDTINFKDEVYVIEYLENI